MVNQVLDELGLQLNDTLSGLPQTAGALPSTGSKQPAAAAAVAGSKLINFIYLFKLCKLVKSFCYTPYIIKYKINL